MVTINEEDNINISEEENLDEINFVDEEEVISNKDDSSKPDDVNASAVEKSAANQEEGNPDVKSEDTVPPVVQEEWKPLSDEEQKNLTARLKALEKENAEKQKLIDRQGNELGPYRKSRRELVEEVIPELTEEDKKSLDDIAYNEGATAHTMALNALIRKKQKEIQEKKANEFQEKYDKNMIAIKEYCPDFDSVKHGIKDILISDGIPENIANEVIENPGTEDPFLIKQLAQRAKEKAGVGNIEAELARLKAENEALKAGIKNGNKTLLADIERASRIPHTITSSTVKKQPVKNKPGTFEEEEPTYEELSAINFVDDED